MSTSRNTQVNPVTPKRRVPDPTQQEKAASAKAKGTRSAGKPQPPMSGKKKTSSRGERSGAVGG